VHAMFANTEFNPLIERLKILLVMQKDSEVRYLQQTLEQEHIVRSSPDLDWASQVLQNCRPDMVVADEQLGRDCPNAGLVSAERCRAVQELGHGRQQTQSIILLPTRDWHRFKAARRTGAHVVVKEPNFDNVARYIQTIADDVANHRWLEPVLF